MLEILARIRAIWQTAKLYHWLSKGNNFQGDHELFDRVANEFRGGEDEDDASDKFVDTLAEAWFMSEGRDQINELVNLDTNTSQYMGQKDNLVDNKVMVKSLIKIIEDLKPLLDSDDYNQGVKAVLDNVATCCDQCLGLLTGRVTESNNSHLSIRKLVESRLLDSYDSPNEKWESIKVGGQWIINDNIVRVIDKKDDSVTVKYGSGKTRELSKEQALKSLRR